MTSTDRLTMQLAAAMVTSLAIELNLVLLLDSSRGLATVFLIGDVALLVAFLVSFVAADTRQVNADAEARRLAREADQD